MGAAARSLQSTSCGHDLGIANCPLLTQSGHELGLLPLSPMA
jgi:hypothetical protein